MEDCLTLRKLEREEMNERNDYYQKATAQILKPLSASIDGSIFASALDFYKFGDFDSIETIPQKDGSTLWLVKKKNVLQKAAIISSDTNAQKKMEIFLNNPETCLPAVEVVSGIRALGEGPPFEEILSLNEGTCANPPRSILVPNKKEISDLCHKHFPRTSKSKRAAPTGAR